jgi:hypothetical protein
MNTIKLISNTEPPEEHFFLLDNNPDFPHYLSEEGREFVRKNKNVLVFKHCDCMDNYERQLPIVKDLVYKYAFVKQLLLDKEYNIKMYDIKDLTPTTVSEEEAVIFLERNNIKGRVPYSSNKVTYYGLRDFKDDLICLLALTKSRWKKHRDKEIVRFCWKLGCYYKGALYILLRFASNFEDVSSIISFNEPYDVLGNMERELAGFELEKKTSYKKELGRGYRTISLHYVTKIG